MVGFIIVGIAILAFLIIMAVAYLKPGPDQGKPATSPDTREDPSQPPRGARGTEWPMGP
jgi:hypothetical protein